MTEGLHDRRILVTGGSRGIGLEVSRELARRGASVTIVARNAERLTEALSSLPGDGHETIAFDVSDESAWQTAARALDRTGPVHGLVTAAAVLGPIGPIDQIPMDEFARALEANLLGTALALHYTVPQLRATAGRAVTFSGGGGTSPLGRYDAYAASKAAVIRLTENVAELLSGEVELNCVAPGFVATGIHEATLSAGPERAGAEYHAHTVDQLESGGVAAREAAELICFLLSAEAAGITGRLISAQWDPWREETFRGRLRGDRSLATLRRIDGMLFGPIDA